MLSWLVSSGRNAESNMNFCSVCAPESGQDSPCWRAKWHCIFGWKRKVVACRYQALLLLFGFVGSSCVHGLFLKRAVERRGRDCKYGAGVHREGGVLTHIIYESSTPRYLFPGRRTASGRQPWSERPWRRGRARLKGLLAFPAGTGGCWKASGSTHMALRFQPRPLGKPTGSGRPSVTVSAEAAASPLPPRRCRCPFKARPARGSGAGPERWRHGAGGGTAAPAPRDGTGRDSGGGCARVCGAVAAAALPGRAWPRVSVPGPWGRLERGRCGARPWSAAGRGGERRRGEARWTAVPGERADGFSMRVRCSRCRSVLCCAGCCMSEWRVFSFSELGLAKWAVCRMINYLQT